MERGREREADTHTHTLTHTHTHTHTHTLTHTHTHRQRETETLRVRSFRERKSTSSSISHVRPHVQKQELLIQENHGRNPHTLSLKQTHQNYFSYQWFQFVSTWDGSCLDLCLGWADEPQAFVECRARFLWCVWVQPLLELLRVNGWQRHHWGIVVLQHCITLHYLHPERPQAVLGVQRCHLLCKQSQSVLGVLEYIRMLLHHDTWCDVRIIVMALTTDNHHQ